MKTLRLIGVLVCSLCTVAVADSGKPELTTIRVDPNPATVRPGQVRKFRAIGIDQEGRRHSIDPVWTATGGSVDGYGEYHAGDVEGRYRITASVDGVVGHSPVRIVAPESFVWPTDGWVTASPTEVGMDETLLQQAQDYARTGSGAGFITRHGKLVMSWGDPARKFGLKSTTKSIGSVIVGLALEDGLIELNDLALDHFAEFGVPPASNGETGWLDDITLKHLATMTAGFDKAGGFIELLYEPGTAWAYTDGGANWLADTLTVIYQMDLLALLETRVNAHLNIPASEFTWRLNDYRPDTLQGITRREFGSGISASVDAMARIGYLMLRDGYWEGAEVIPQTFVEELRTTVPEVVGLPVENDTDQIYANASDHYGLLWWNNADGSMPDVPTDAFWSWGLHDSTIFVVPSLDIVVSRAGQAWAGNRNPSYYQVFEPFFTPIAQSVDPSGNQVPFADAGPDQSIVVPPTTIVLDGFASDDGLPDPPGELTVLWSQVSGPGAVGFGDPSSSITSATFLTEGVYVLRLTADDGELVDSDTVSITVSISNSPPVANDDFGSTAQNTLLTLPVAANDTDAEGNLDPGSVNVSCSGCSSPAHGTLFYNGDGSFNYQPDLDYLGLDAFVYEVCDTLVLCDIATVTITVEPFNGDMILSDDFESGDTSAWTNTVP